MRWWATFIRWWATIIQVRSRCIRPAGVDVGQVDSGVEVLLARAVAITAQKVEPPARGGSAVGRTSNRTTAIQRLFRGLAQMLLWQRGPDSSIAVLDGCCHDDVGWTLP